MKKSTIISLVGIILAVLGVVLFLFLDVVSLPDDKLPTEFVAETIFTGKDIIFGYKVTAGSGALEMSYSLLGMSILGLIPLICAVGGIVLVLLGSNNKGLKVLGSVLFIVAGVLFVLAPNFVSFVDQKLGDKVIVSADEIKEGLKELDIWFKATSGAYIGAIVTVLGGLVSLVSAFVKK